MKTAVNAGRGLLAAVFLFAALLIAGAVALMSAHADELPIRIPEGENEPVHTIESFFSCLKAGDFDGAYAHMSDATLGLENCPQDENSALLWQAQRAAWDYSIADGYGMDGSRLTRRVTVSGVDFSSAAPAINERVQAMLAEDTENATFAADVLDENGNYDQELIMAHLRTALEELAAAPEAYRRSWELTVHLAYLNGEWKLVPDRALVTALTGGAVRESGSPDALTAGYEMFVNNLVSTSLQGLTVVPKVYWLAEDTVVAPKPNKALFGTSKNPADTAPVLESVAALLEGRDVLWSPEIQTIPGREIRWYADETIFAMCWKQTVKRVNFNFCEIVIGHPSQFRRYIADNSFKSARRYFPTAMAKTVNAVVALSGDFIKFRNMGICVYQRELCRSDGRSVDTCFVNSAGDLLLVHRGELKTEEAIRQYIEENDVVFSLAFGPIMIENGENVMPKTRYPIGQPYNDYTRCVLCQLGEGHYLLATVNVAPGGGMTLDTVTNALISLGVPKAYSLDGGQTASLIINNRLFNTVDYDQERTMSDIIYFATAIPEEEE